MRIKWTSIHSVVTANPVAPWVGLGLTERLKREVVSDPAKNEKEKKKSSRALAWFRRSR